MTLPQIRASQARRWDKFMYKLETRNAAGDHWANLVQASQGN